MLTNDEIVQTLPPSLRKSVSPQFVADVNAAATDPEMAAVLRENFITFTSVLKDGKFKLQDYLNAVKFVSYIIMGKTNLESYQLTFPQRYASLKARGVPTKDVSSYASQFRKNMLVEKIFELSITPAWIRYNDVYNQAIAVQAELMVNAQSEKVRTDAANSILTHLARPKEAKIQLDVGVQESAGMAELRDLLTGLAQKSQELIGQGVGVKDITGQRIFNTIENEQ